MTEQVDQRNCIKFCFKLEHSFAETIRMIKKAFGDDSMSEAQIKLWYKRFKDGRESVASDPRSGSPSTSRTPENIERVRAAINENRRLTVRELEEDLGIPRTSVSEILTKDLGMKRLTAKFVPKLLSREQKEFRAEVAEVCFKPLTMTHISSQVINGDESWFYGYDPETKAQSSQWKLPASPRPKKARQSRSNVKAMLTVFFEHEGVVHYEYAPPGQTITKEYYIEVLHRLRNA
ncbi:protein GVQW3-like, partial [Homarus americanus]|uniref:protein GVQW3-like n=1 Tax=Homarus americanus TaxID=6706 RepID=UPI001C48936C